MLSIVVSEICEQTGVISTLCVVGFVGNVLSFGVLCSNCPFRCASLDC